MNTAKEGLAYMAVYLRGAVGDAQLAVEDQLSLRLSVKSKNALEQAWKQYLASHATYMMKEKNEDLVKDAEIQHRQRKRNFNRALEDLEVYIESLEVNVEVDETPRLLAKENVRLAEVEGERKCNHLE